MISSLTLLKCDKLSKPHLNPNTSELRFSRVFFNHDNVYDTIRFSVPLLPMTKWSSAMIGRRDSWCRLEQWRSPGLRAYSRTISW